MKRKNKFKILPYILIGAILLGFFYFGIVQQTIYPSYIVNYPSVVVSIGNVGNYACSSNPVYASPDWVGWKYLVRAYVVENYDEYEVMFRTGWDDWVSTTNRWVSDTTFFQELDKGVQPQESCDGTIKNCNFASDVQWELRSDNLCYIVGQNIPVEELEEPVIIPEPEPIEEPIDTPDNTETPSPDTQELTGFALWWNLVINWFKGLFS